ncbi:endoplasmic reticulum resident protein 44-like isoform X2 [Maniola jurtina]|uniref:endoplasmic reticulum resident protein 44-like isoform X2 n=1 Tax=Maniola jurtina TaxID=191418 RepID=UPI001E68ED4F|nr:endoplasmic reticulum resident protein 44-like isoform X2 [Maniola jurtina]
MEDNTPFVPTDTGIIQITQDNLNTVLGANEVVLITFYTEWCRFSSLMMPVFADAAQEITKAGYEAGKVALGPRTVEAFVEFIKEQLTDPIILFSHLNELHDLSEDKGHIIARLASRDQPEYDVLRKVASSLKDKCQFHVTFDEYAEQRHPRTGQPSIVFRTNRKTLVEPDEPYQGPLSFSALCTWVQEKCFPLVREITYENAEKLSEEGMPFLILLHKPADEKSVKKFIEVIRRELRHEKRQLNFVTAEGIRFERMLHLIGKSTSELPLIVVDHYQSIYLFPDYNDMEEPGKIKQFLQDLYSSKLRKQGIFLYKPSPNVNIENPINEAGDEDTEDLSFGLFD